MNPTLPHHCQNMILDYAVCRGYYEDFQRVSKTWFGWTREIIREQMIADIYELDGRSSRIIIGCATPLRELVMIRDHLVNRFLRRIEFGTQVIDY